MRVINVCLIACGTVMTVTSTALAQSDIAPRSAVSFMGGAGATSSTTGVAVGGSLLFDLNDRTSVEAQGTYLDRGAGVDAVSFSGNLLVNLLPAYERIVPYAAVGVGIHRTSFDLGHPALFGNVGAQFGPGSLVCPAPGAGVGSGPGVGFGFGSGTCPAAVAGYWGVGQMPHFYARRLGPMAVPLGEGWGTHSFTDPAISVGGGLRFNATEHLMVRPDVRALVVLADGDTHTVAVFGVQLGYRF
jgi:hypothetical protein